MNHAQGQTESPIQVTIGHATDKEARTGCTVVLFDRPAISVVDVRGGAPGTRETDLLTPGRLVRRADAIFLTGGSAFGLAAADGVMQFLSERGRGVATRTRSVPIVPAAVVYDLAVGTPHAPDATAGWQACQSAGAIDRLMRGQVGAGTGATTGKLPGCSSIAPGGLGVGQWSWNEGQVTAIAVVNAYGVVSESRTMPVDSLEALGAVFSESPAIEYGRESTTLAVVLVDIPVDHSTLVLCTIAAHDAMARTIQPCHTIFDGDVAFASGLREASSVLPSDALKIGIADGIAVERAILDAVAVH